MMNRRPRLWLFSELYYPEETSTGHIVTRIAEGIAGSQPVGVICAQPTYSGRGVIAPRKEHRNGTYIYRVASTRFDKNVTLYRVLNQLTVGTTMFFQALRLLRKSDVVLAVTNPPLLPLVVALAAKIRRAHYSVIVHDVYPDVMVAAGMTQEGGFVARAIDALTRWMYRRADRIVVLGRDMQGLVRSKLDPALADRVVVITNWADTEQIRPQPPDGSSLLAELQIADQFVVQFAGNIGPLQNIPFLVDAASQLEGNRVHFLFVGDGGRRAELERVVEERRLSNVTVRDWVPRDQAGEIHRACHAVVISLIPGMTGVSVPSRLYNALASGRPILAACDPDSEVGRVVAEEGVGWVVQPGDVDGLCEALRQAVANPEQVQEMGARSRAVAELKYTEERIVQQFVRLVETLVEDASP